MEANLARPRAIMYGSLAIAFLIAIPWVGAWTLIPLVFSVVTYALLRPRIATSARPEYVVFASDGGAAMFEPLFAAADEALYEAKRAGRNRVVAAGYDEPLPLAA